MAITKLRRVTFVIAISMKMSKCMNHGYALVISSKSLNENCPIASSKVFFTVFHKSEKSSNSAIARLNTQQKIINMIPYKIMNFAKS